MTPPSPRGLATVRWPGRLERLQERRRVYLDGTHNPAGARELVAFWDEQFAGRRIHLVYGAMRDKAVDEVAGLLFPRAATVILTQSRQPRALSAEALAAMTQHLARLRRSHPRSRRRARTRARTGGARTMWSSLRARSIWSAICAATGTGGQRTKCAAARFTKPSADDRGRPWFRRLRMS